MLKRKKIIFLRIHESSHRPRVFCKRLHHVPFAQLQLLACTPKAGYQIMVYPSFSESLYVSYSTLIFLLSMCKSFAKARGSHVAQTTSWLPIWRTRAGPPSSSNPWHKRYQHYLCQPWWRSYIMIIMTNTRQTGLVVPVDLKLSIGIFVVRLVNTEVTGIQCLHLAISKLIKTIWNFRDISWSTQQILTRKAFKLVHNLDSIDSTANSKSNFRENMRKLCSQGLTLSSSQGCNDVGQERISSHHGLCIISVPDIQGTLSSFDNEWQRTLITNNLSIIITKITIFTVTSDFTSDYYISIQ